MGRALVVGNQAFAPFLTHVPMPHLTELNSIVQPAVPADAAVVQAAVLAGARPIDELAGPALPSALVPTPSEPGILAFSAANVGAESEYTTILLQSIRLPTMLQILVLKSAADIPADCAWPVLIKRDDCCTAACNEYSLNIMQPVSTMGHKINRKGPTTKENSIAARPLSDFLKREVRLAMRANRCPNISLSCCGTQNSTFNRETLSGEH